MFLPVALRKLPVGVSFLQLFIAVESPFVAPCTGDMSIVVQTQSFSKAAPPAVCILPISYHRPLYLWLVKFADGGGCIHFASAEMRKALATHTDSA